MDEFRINERRNWKAQTFSYDYYLPDNSRSCTYCLTDKQAELLRGIIQPVGWATRWWSDSDVDIDPNTVEEFRDDLIRRLMMSCCGDEIPVQFRYSDEGVLQRSEDGGATWEDAPQFDPRENSPQFPPISGEDGDDKKCVAATGAVDLIKEQVGDQLTNDMSRYTLGELLTDWTGTVINSGGNIFQALVTVATNQIFALVIATLRPALTEEVYEQLQCVLYCNMGDDASISSAQWSQIRSDITAEIGGIAGVFLEHLIYLLGAGGLTNLVRAGGAAAGDCDCGCGDGCDPELWQIWNGGENYGTVVEYGSDYVIVDLMFAPSTVGEYYVRMKTADVDTCCIVSGWEVISGGTINISAGGACGEAQEGGGGINIPTTAGFVSMNRFAFGSTGAARIKIIFL